VLLGHAGPVIAEAARRILEAHGFDAHVAMDTRAVEQALELGGWDALVVDVALPGVPGYELTGFELTNVARNAGVKVVILVASVFRRTSYKRQPRRLYGADDYVEIHDLGAKLPAKLWRLLAGDPADLPGMIEAEAVFADLQDERDADDGEPVDADRLAALLVADLVLHSGDRLADADTLGELRDALAPELDAARATLREVLGPAGGPSTGEADPIDGALAALLRPPGAPAEDRWP
jgi:DNA-binding response OmpR family regulator